MKPSSALASHRQAVREIVMAHNALNPRGFGSSARGDDTAESDLDLLVDPTPETTLLDIGAIRDELIRLLGVPVDVVTPNSLPERIRAEVIAGAIVV